MFSTKISDPNLLNASDWTHVGVELVVLRRQHHLLQVFADPWNSGQVDPVIVQTQKLVDHRLIRPLKQTQT